MVRTLSRHLCEPTSCACLMLQLSRALARFLAAFCSCTLLSLPSSQFSSRLWQHARFGTDFFSHCSHVSAVLIMLYNCRSTSPRRSAPSARSARSTCRTRSPSTSRARRLCLLRVRTQCRALLPQYRAMLFSCARRVLSFCVGMEFVFARHLFPILLYSQFCCVLFMSLSSLQASVVTTASSLVLVVRPSPSSARRFVHIDVSFSVVCIHLSRLSTLPLHAAAHPLLALVAACRIDDN
jgi:hypothetical protein